MLQRHLTIKHRVRRGNQMQVKCIWCLSSTVGTLTFTVIVFRFMPFQTYEDQSAHQMARDIIVEGQIRTARSIITPVKEHLSMKTILLWTSYFGSNYSKDFYYFPNEGQKLFEKYGCEFSQCRVTANRSLLNLADAILFHARDIHDLPKEVSQNQIKILYNLEPPGYSKLRWTRLRGIFNWTMSYRLDSDIIVKYGQFCPVSEHVTQLNIGNKTKGAIWISSNCRTDGRREKYISILKEYFPVDIYGKCGPNNCMPKQSQHCYDSLLPQYKFYLSFENSICKDYVTEKFYNALKYNVIPIVFGGADYDNIAPLNSVIDAKNFPHPKDLGRFLKQVSSDEILYNSYFKWKKIVSVHLHPWMCDLCKKLHIHDGNPSIVQNPGHWWITKAKCRKWINGLGYTSRSLIKNATFWS